MALPPSRLGKFISRYWIADDDAMIAGLREEGLLKRRVPDWWLRVIIRRAREEHESFPEGQRLFNSPHERLRIFLGPLLTRKGRAWAEPFYVPPARKLKEEEPGPSERRPWWRFW